MTSPDSESIRIKRVYRRPRRSDGCRVLVDRLWPRGLTTETAFADIWMKDIAPSNELRRWYAHDPERWPNFRDRYRIELETNPDATQQLLALCNDGVDTLLFAARDEQHSNARVLRDWLREQQATRTHCTSTKAESA